VGGYQIHIYPKAEKCTLVVGQMVLHHTDRPQKYADFKAFLWPFLARNKGKT
jgi:hypothetical protein